MAAFFVCIRLMISGKVWEKFYKYFSAFCNSISNSSITRTTISYLSVNYLENYFASYANIIKEEMHSKTKVRCLEIIRFEIIPIKNT